MCEKLTEEVIVDKIIDFMINKVDGIGMKKKLKKVICINMELI